MTPGFAGARSGGRPSDQWWTTLQLDAATLKSLTPSQIRLSKRARRTSDLPRTSQSLDQFRIQSSDASVFTSDEAANLIDIGRFHRSVQTLSE